MKYSLSFLAAMAIASTAMAADVQLDNADSLRTGSGWRGNDGPCPATVALDTVDKVEGIASVKANVNYTAAEAWHEGFFFCDLATPTDFSTFSELSFDLKSNAPANYILTTTIIDPFGSGFIVPFESLSGYAAWGKLSLGANEFYRSAWQGASWWDNTAMNRISTIKWNATQGVNSAAAQFDVWIDDVRIDNELPSTLVAEVIDPIDAVAGWTIVPSENPLNTVTFAADAGAIKMTPDMKNWYANVTLEKDLDVNLGQYTYLKFDIKGTMTPGSASPLFLMSFMDVDGNRAWAYVKAAVQNGEWTTIGLPVAAGRKEGIGGALPALDANDARNGYLIQDVWDRPDDKRFTESIDLTKIAKIQLNFQTGTQDATCTGDIWIKNLVGIKDAPPPPPSGKSATAIKATSPIAISGAGDDAQWANADWNGDFTNALGFPIGADFASRFKLMYDANFLYFLIEQTSKGDAKRYFTPDTNATSAANFGYYNPAKTDESMWIDAIDLRLSPRTASPAAGAHYQVLPYFFTDATGVPQNGNGRMYTAANWAALDPQADGGVKGKVTADTLTLEGKFPFAAMDKSWLNTNSAAVQPAPTPESVWFLDSYRACWLTSDSPTVGAGASSWWSDEDDYLQLTFDHKADVADWSVF